MKKTLFLIHITKSTFVDKDIKTLSSHYNLITYYFSSKKDIFSFIAEYIKLFFFLIPRIKKIDVVISWFCDYHSLLPVWFAKMLKKKSMIIIGGFDATSVPHLNYGLFAENNLRTKIAIKSYKLANLLLPVDISLIEGLNLYADPKGIGYPTGVKSYIPNFNKKYIVLPTGYDSDIWHNTNKSKRNKKTVVSVANVLNVRTFKLKGYDLILETAKLLPDFMFTLVGLNNEMLEYAKKTAGKNVTLISSVENNKLPELLSQNYIYAHLSDTEGLPNALCEAMLCECVPVGSNVNGIPRGIGDAGFLLMERDARKAAELFKQASETDEQSGKLARQRIVDLFPNSKREQKLMDIIEKSSIFVE